MNLLLNIIVLIYLLITLYLGYRVIEAGSRLRTRKATW